VADYQDLKKQFEGIATAAGSTTGKVDEDVLKKIIAGTHGSYSVKDDTIVREAGSDYVAPEGGTYSPPKTRKDQRSSLLLPDYENQARSQVSPAYDRLINQLRSDVSASRSAIPRRLLARGQSVGGQRSLQEGELDRQLAYGTADINAQRQQAIQQQAQALRDQAAEEQRWQQEFGLQQDQFELQQQQQAYNEYVQNRQLELQEQGFTADEAWRQAQIELEQMGIAEDKRQFNISEANDMDYKNRLFNAQYSGGSGGVQQPEEVDVSDYRQYIESYLIEDPNAVISYINNLQIPDTAKNRLRNIYGIQKGTVDPNAQVVLDRMGVGDTQMQETVQDTMITPQSVQEPQEVQEETEINDNVIDSVTTNIYEDRSLYDTGELINPEGVYDRLIQYYNVGRLNPSELYVATLNLGLSIDALENRIDALTSGTE